MTQKGYHSPNDGATPLDGSPGRKSAIETRTPETDSNFRINVTLRSATKPGSIKAHADVRVELASSSLELFGLSVVQHDPEKSAWVSYPQRVGKDGRKYFHIVKVTGALHEKICIAVLREFERVMSSAGNRDNPERPVGEDDSVPF